MALKDITERINQEIKKTIAELEQETSAKIERIIFQAKEEAKRKEKEILSIAQKEAEARRRNKLTWTRLEMRKKILAQKQKIIDEIFEKAYQQIISSPFYQQFLKKLVLKYSESGEEEIIVSEKNQRLVEGEFLNRVNAQLRERGKKGEIKLSSEKRPIEGLILSQPRKEINCSLSVIFSQVREKLTAPLAQLLFKEEEGERGEDNITSASSASLKKTHRRSTQ
jgi:V/A-type H+-transporting ATPase subunit E